MTTGYPAVADGRARAIGSVADDHAGLRAVSGPDAESLTEALLGLRGLARVAVAPSDRRLVRVLDALRYRTAAYVEAYEYGPGGALVVSVGRLLAEVAEYGLDPPAGFPDPRSLPADLRDALLARPAAPDRWVPATAGRTRIGPRPTLVFSTAGSPPALDAALRGYLTEFRRAGNDDLRVLVVDDARTADVTAVDTIISAVAAETGARIGRFAERAADGGPGPKARVRAAVAREVMAAGGGDLLGDLDRVLAPDACGSANAAFLLLAGRPVVWLEQDAHPYALRLATPAAVPVPAGAAPSGALPVERAVEVTGADRLVREPVDVLHVVDRLLYGEPEYPGYADEHPTWEDAGHEAVRRAEPAWGLRPRMCHFHVLGHPDYRAQYLHNSVTTVAHDPRTRAVLLAGGLDRLRVLAAPPSPAIVANGTSAFGTVVGFHHELPLPVPTMAATRVRIIDFTVGLLLRAAGACPAAWAGTGLTHLREQVTSSGRGVLAPYLALEELLWPLYHALERLLAEVPRADGEDPGHWLARAGTHIESAARTWQPPPQLSSRLWRDQLCDEAVAAGTHPADVAAHLAALRARRPAGPVAANRRATARLRGELRDYGRQLRLWAMLTPQLLARVRRSAAGAYGEL